MEKLNDQIGERLRVIRLGRNWSLGRLEKECGVSKAMLGQIERRESNPTVQTLWRIAKGLQLSLSELLPKELHHTAHPNMESNDSALSVKVLLPFDMTMGYEVLLVTIREGCEYISRAHEDGVTEDVLPIDGSLSIHWDSEWRLILPGEALRFAADRQHGYRNENNKPICFYNILRYPQRGSRPSA